MDPFEDLMHQLSGYMGVPLHPDAHQSCLIQFAEEGLLVQIDLDTNADRILVGSELGQITSGTYRERILRQALIVNGSSRTMQGILAFSKKNDTLILFQHLTLANLNGQNLHEFLEIFITQAKIWKHAVSLGEIPHIQEFAKL